MHNWYFLDEDCRKKSPEGMHCARCKKPIKQSAIAGISFQQIFLHPTEMYFRKSAAIEMPKCGEVAGLLGSDCWKKIQEYGSYDDSLNKIT